MKRSGGAPSPPVSGAEPATPTPPPDNVTAGAPLVPHKPQWDKNNTRRHFSTAENVQHGPILMMSMKSSTSTTKKGAKRSKRSKKGKDDTHVEGGSTTSSSRSSKGGSTDTMPSSKSSLTSGSSLLVDWSVKDLRNRHTSASRPSADAPDGSNYLSLMMAPLSKSSGAASHAQSKQNFTTQNASSVVLSVNIPEGGGSDRPSVIGTTVGFIQGLPHLEDKDAPLSSFLSQVKETGYGEMDFINYTKEGSPYVNRLSLSPEGDHFLAIMQTYRSPSTQQAQAVTDSAESNNTDSNNSSSLDGHSGEDTSSSGSGRGKGSEEKLEIDTTSSSSSGGVVPDTDVTAYLSLHDMSASSSDDRGSSSDHRSTTSNSDSDEKVRAGKAPDIIVDSDDMGAEEAEAFSDKDVAMYLAKDDHGWDDAAEKEPVRVSTIVAEEPAESKRRKRKSSDITGASSRNGNWSTKGKAPPPSSATYLIAARIDLETAWKAAATSSMGHNTSQFLKGPPIRQTSTTTTSDHRTNERSVSIPGNQPFGSTTDASTTTTTTTTTVIKANVVTTTTTTTISPSIPSVTRSMHIASQVSGGYPAFISYSRAASESLCVVNSRGQFVHVNPAWTRLTGYQLADADMKSITELLGGPGTDTDLHEQLLRGASAGGSKVYEDSCVILHYKKDGEAFLNRLTFYGIKGEGEISAGDHYVGYFDELKAVEGGPSSLRESFTSRDKVQPQSKDHVPYQSDEGRIIVKVRLVHPMHARERMKLNPQVAASK